MPSAGGVHLIIFACEWESARPIGTDFAAPSDERLLCHGLELPRAEGLAQAGERPEHRGQRVGGVVVDLDKDRLQGAPSYAASEDPDWRDPSYSRRIDDYYGPFPGVEPSKVRGLTSAGRLGPHPACPGAG